MTCISWSSDVLLLFFCTEKHFSFIDKAWFRRATLYCDSSYFLIKKHYTTFLKKINGELLLYLPHTLDSGLAQLSNRCRSCPIDISLDIDIWLNILSNKNWFWGKKELTFHYLQPRFCCGSVWNYPKCTGAAPLVYNSRQNIPLNTILVLFF